jgi:hypothetical protein
MTDVKALLRAARALAEARRTKAGLHYRIHGGLTPEGGELAFVDGQYFRASEGEAVEDFWFRVSEAADGPAIFGGLPELPGTNVRWRAKIETPNGET